MITAVALGGNHADAPKRVKEAAQELLNYLDTAKCSTLYETPPLGPGTRSFINAVVIGHDPGGGVADLWDLCLKLEGGAGRDPIHETVWGDRPLDCDILLYGDAILVENPVTIPHPQLHRRSFVLEPLVEVGGGVIHPVFSVSINELWKNL